ncbi:hypothetical protein PGT21_015306 [Puccinia graminis f. sp. tritici]|uniref:Uncharacterized protein n=1 Tax=Puccinia graminis f. sp. tritici TaxID=56615 RepID=A0A5B0M080_PUCGR|nr:hypothetical protein PGT21_015306 [Puccinia graminis f. sp. tritici]
MFFVVWVLCKQRLSANIGSLKTQRPLLRLQVSSSQLNLRQKNAARKIELPNSRPFLFLCQTRTHLLFSSSLNFFFSHILPQNCPLSIIVIQYNLLVFSFFAIYQVSLQLTVETTSQKRNRY